MNNKINKISRHKSQIFNPYNQSIQSNRNYRQIKQKSNHNRVYQHNIPLKSSSLLKRNIGISVINKISYISSSYNSIHKDASHDNNIKINQNNFYQNKNVDQLLNIFKNKLNVDDKFVTKQVIPKTIFALESQKNMTQINNNQIINKINKEDINQRNIKTANNQLNKRSNSNNNLNTGKIHRGKNILPQFVPSKQQRLNPFYQKPQIISQKIINSQGIYNLLSVGILPKQYNFVQLLNTKYQLIQQNQKNTISNVMKIQTEEQGFITNPMLLQYQQNRKIIQAELNKNQKKQQQNVQSRIQQSKNKLRKTKIKKLKKQKNKKQNQPIIDIFPEKIQILTVINGKLQKSQQNYQQFYKKCLQQGTQTQFQLLVSKMQEFCQNSNLKKIRFKPNLSFVKSYSNQILLSMIQNYQIFGIKRCTKSKQQKFKAILLRSIAMLKYKIYKKCLNKIQKIKKYFRFRKLYYENIENRYQFFKYKFVSFAQQQKKFTQNFSFKLNQNKGYFPKVQIHIFSMKNTFEEEKTYYKLKQRLRAQLTRIFNMEATDIIILTDPQLVGHVQQEMVLLIKMAQKIGKKFQKLNKNKPNIHIFQTILNGQPIRQTARTYFGLNKDIIKFIKKLCKKQKPLIIPYQSSKYLPLICQTFNGNLFGGTYTNQTIQKLLQPDKIQVKQYLPQKTIIDKQGRVKKFTKIQKRQTYLEKIECFDKFTLANTIFQNKNNTYELFIKFNKFVPFRIRLKNKNHLQFCNQVAKAIIYHKQSTKWILKLPQSTFSRGIALLQTNDLKIFQQKRKKTFLTQNEIQEVSNLIQIILKDKICLSHPNLFEKKQFVDNFFSNQESYFQQFIQDSQKICIFGKLLPNGEFIFQGSYKKIYSVNLVGFGASYPASQVTKDLVNSLNQICKQIVEKNSFGYFTFEFLYQQKSNTFYFLDLIPNLDEYSSFYFFYHSLFQSQKLSSYQFGFNKLTKNIFYCPFLDNNGNEYEEIQFFLQECNNKKIQYNPITQQGQKFIFYNNDANVLSVISFGSSQYLAMKGCIEAIAFLIENGGKFNQFDKKYITGRQLKMDGIYIMDILWKMREIKKKYQSQNLIINQQILK